MKKIALIVQRYGEEVNGGAEYHCRILAEKLQSLFDVEILTSCAKDYISWANAYTEGESVINGVKVHRFEAVQERDQKLAHQLSRRLRERTLPQKLGKAFGILSLIEKVFPSKLSEKEIGEEWFKQQGPYIPDLLSYLNAHKDDYHAFIFFTYLYYPTYFGMRIAPEKSILIPTAHDEPPIYFPMFKELFKLPKAILYNTKAEQDFVNQLFDNRNIYSDIVGVGIDAHIHQKDAIRPDVPIIEGPYIIYIGRIDRAKGCKLLFDCFLKYNSTNKTDLKLVLIGTPIMKIPENKNLISLGFVDDDIKYAMLKAANALIIPSYYESLSLVTLESMLAGVPVIANGNCEVLKAHIEQSQSGFLFTDYQSFDASMKTLLNMTPLQTEAMEQKGISYVKDNYNWGTVQHKISKAVDHIEALINKSLHID